MITFVLDADVLGQTRFAISPLAEVTQSLRVLGQGRDASYVHAPWLRQVHGLLGAVDMDLLMAVAPQGPYIPSCLVPSGESQGDSIEKQLNQLRHLEPSRFEHDFREVWQASLRPERISELVDSQDDAAGRLADELGRYWAAAIRPFWSRMRAVLEDDVTHRFAGLVEKGFYALLDELHPEMRVEENRLYIDKPHFAPATYVASEMVLTPSIFAWPNLVIVDGEGGRFGMTYAARGVARVWERANHKVEGRDWLAPLVGRSRAAILRAAAVPVTTTQIARELDQSPPAVSEHLAVLQEAGLVTSKRSGRNVFYRQTPLAETVVGSGAGPDRATRP